MMPPYDTRLLRETHRPPTGDERAAAILANAERDEEQRTAFTFIRRRMRRFFGRTAGFASKFRIRLEN